MKQLILTALMCIVFFGIQGQNLVPNGNFEDTLRCTSDSAKLTPRFWYSPTNGTPDYFYGGMSPHFGCISSSSPPAIWNGQDSVNSWGRQNPHSGLAYVGFVISYGQEYMAVPLIDSLTSGKKYCFEVYISLAESSTASMDLIQFCLSRNKITRYDTIGSSNFFLDSAHGAISTVENPPGTFIADTNGWVLLSDTFTAQGGERYLTVGNFDSLHTNYIYPSGDSSSTSVYYYFDDLSIYYCDIPSDTNPHENPPDISLFPNPSNGEISLNGEFPEKTSIEIFNMLGQVVFVSNVPQGNHSTQLFLSLSQGIYLYRIKATDILKSGKLIIMK